MVRLSDWLGPIDELVPFGPRADAQHAASHPSAGHTGDELGGASGFWDGDTSVHTAVPAPGTLGPSTADAPARVTTTSGWFARTHETLLLAVANRFSRLSWRVALAAAVGLAAAVVLFAALGSGSSDRRIRTTQASIGTSRSAPTLNGLGIERAGAAAVSRAAAHERMVAQARHRRLERAKRAAERRLRRRHAARVAAAVASRQSTSASASEPTTAATTPAYTPTQAQSEPAQTTPTGADSSSSYSTTSSGGTSAGGTSPSSGGSSSSGSSSSSGDSSSSSSSKTPAYGPAGALSPGSSPNG